MGKRKAGATEAQPPTKDKMDIDGEEDESDEDIDLLNVDFEWFDPQPAVDFHGLKTLLRQLFDVDNQLFDLSELSDMILAQPLLGSTVKCDGNESDPYAFLTVLNLHTHRTKPVVQRLTAYLLDRTKDSSDPNLHTSLQNLLSAESEAQVGLILTERFINMPHQIVPPMYNMLLEEVQWALDAKEPYQFSHYLVISKTYTEVASTLDAEDNPPSKKSKAGKKSGGEEVFYFHPEDEVLQKHAMGFANFEYEKQSESESDAKRAFQELGVKAQGHLILMEAAKFEGAVKAVGEYLNSE